MIHYRVKYIMDSHNLNDFPFYPSPFRKYYSVQSLIVKQVLEGKYIRFKDVECQVQDILEFKFLVDVFFFL